jgi:hypothetical protein
MMKKSEIFDIGRQVVVTAMGDTPQKSRVINRIGNYVILENGIKFHVLDDYKGVNCWFCGNNKTMISPINQNP